MSLVADTSAFVGILLKEPGADTYRNTLLNVDKVLISAATAVELHIGGDRKARHGRNLDRLLSQPLFEIVSMDHQQMTAANLAFERYGKGRTPQNSIMVIYFHMHWQKARICPCCSKVKIFRKQIS
jgi:ribonuclease VapC